MKKDFGFPVVKESDDDWGKWDGRCVRPDCSRTKPPIAYGKALGECFTHEMLGTYFQYEMAGEEDGWREFDEIKPNYEIWLKKLIDEGIDLDKFAEAFANS